MLPAKINKISFGFLKKDCFTIISWMDNAEASRIRKGTIAFIWIAISKMRSSQLNGCGIRLKKNNADNINEKAIKIEKT